MSRKENEYTEKVRLVVIITFDLVCVIQKSFMTKFKGNIYTDAFTYLYIHIST